MKRLLLFTLFSSLSLISFGGVRMQMDITDLKTNKVTKQEMLVDSTRLRVNVDNNTSVMFLTDGGRNRMVILDKQRNTYQEMDQQTINQLGQQMQGAMAQMQDAMKNMPPEQRAMMERMMKGKMPAAAPAAPAKTVYTSKGSGSANGFSCTKYDGMRGAEKVSEVCAAAAGDVKLNPNDYQVFEKMRDFVSALTSQMPMVGNQMNGFGDSGLQGFPVQTKIGRAHV